LIGFAEVSGRGRDLFPEYSLPVDPRRHRIDDDSVFAPGRVAFAGGLGGAWVLRAPCFQSSKKRLSRLVKKLT